MGVKSKLKKAFKKVSKKFDELFEDDDIEEILNSDGDDAEKKEAIDEIFDERKQRVYDMFGIN